MDELDELMREVMQLLEAAVQRAEQGVATPADWALIRQELGLTAFTTERK
jgi:alkyl hydroperoxide reductase subunit AhpC